MTIKINQILENHLTAYANLLTAQIDSVGYAGEFISDSIATNLMETRLLCQTRGIFFLVDYANITGNNIYIGYALKLYHVIQDNYYSQSTQTWTQYPQQVTNQNTHKDKMLYEYAFVMTSFAKLYATTNDEKLLELINQVRNIIFAEFYNHKDKFAKLYNKENGLNQNALMHLFEAFLEVVNIVEDTKFKNDLQEFGTNLLHEIYDKEMCLIREYSNKKIFEPGHSFEWASLIYEASAKNVFSTELVSHEKLATTAEKFGVTSAQMVLAEINDVQANNQDYRIWPLLERLRYYVMIGNNKYKLVLSALVTTFFSNKDLPYEYVNEQLMPMQEKVKSTTGYHIINCYKYILNDNI